MHLDKIQFFVSLLSLMCVAISYWYSVKEYKQTNTVFSKIKLFSLLITLAALIVWFKDLAKISFIFIILALATLIKFNGKQDSGMDMGK